MTGAFLLDWTEAHAESPLPSSPFMGRSSERAAAHARGRSYCGQGCRDCSHNDLQDQFPDVLVFHGFLFYWFNNSFAAAIVSSDIKRRLSMTAIAFMSAGHSFSVSLSFPPKLVSLHTAAM